MTTARKHQVDKSISRHYHVVSRCVRKLPLLKSKDGRRKNWLERRLRLLAQNFAIGVAGFAFLDNHLHINLRIDFDVPQDWSDEEVVRRWTATRVSSKLAQMSKEDREKLIQEEAKDKKRVAELRERLENLGWFMKMLKEPLARMANAEDSHTGTFWDGRYKAIAILDPGAILATNAYVDLNAFAAGAAPLPELGRFSSFASRLKHLELNGHLSKLGASVLGSIYGSQIEGNCEQNHWLIPIQDRRPHTNAQPSSDREGLLEGYSIGSYILFVDYVARLCRDDKAQLDPRAKPIFERLGIDVEQWGATTKEMFNSTSLRGRLFACDKAEVKKIADLQDRRHLANLSPQS